MEKFSVLFKSYESVYAQGSPVIISARALIKNNESGKVFVQLKFKNITEKIINAVKVDVECFDAFGNELEGIQGFDYLELCAKRNDDFGNKKLIPLSNANTRSFKVKCTEVLYSDGSSAECDEFEEWTIIPEQIDLESKLGTELATQYRREVLEKAVYVPDSEKDIWRCTCGSINKKSETVCNLCGCGWIEQYMALDTDTLTSNLEKFKIAEREREEAAKREAERIAEEARVAAEIQKKKNAKTLKIVVPIVVAIIALIIIFVTVIKPSSDYKSAVALMESGKYNAAISVFKDLGDYKDSETQILECRYRIADSAADKGDYAEAISLFKELGGYKDSKNRINECENEIKEEKYQNAIVYKDRKDYKNAIDAFSEIKGYKDANEQLNECKELYDEERYQKAVNLFKAGKFSEARNAFSEIKHYKDSAEQIKTIEKEEKYQKAVGLMEKGKYKEALNIFKQIKGYKDADKKITTCNNKIKGTSSSSSGGGGGSSSSSGFKVEQSSYKNVQGRVEKKYRLTCKNCGAYQHITVDFGTSKSSVSQTVKCQKCLKKATVTFR